MKKYFLFVASALAIAGCSSDDFLGNDSSNGLNTANAVIKLGGSTTKTSRATSLGIPYNLKSLQGNGFWVYGTKHANAEDGTKTNDQVVYKNYRLEYTDGSNHNTQSNTAGWEYVGINNDDYFSHVTPNITENNPQNNPQQTIKYWDYSAQSYTFYAATALHTDVADGKVTFNKILDDGENGSVYNKGYNVTLKDGADLDQLYFADRKVIEKTTDAEHGKDDFYGGEVNFKFRNALTKVRVAMYETVPGYSVKIDKFYYTQKGEGGQTTEAAATDKFTADANNTPFATSANGVTYKVVYYKDTEAGGLLKDQPKMLPNETGEGSPKSTLAIGDGNNLREGTILNKEVNNPTFDTDGGSYTFFMPQADNNETLKLKVDYTLTSDDGSNEEIKVTGATAIIPAEYLRWKPNYAYTYLFKISDNTNGSTGEGGPAGLYPITFDASVVETANGNAEFISALGTSTITTFAVKDKFFQQGKADYEAGSDLYATVVDNQKQTVTLTADNAKLYQLTAEALKFKEPTSTIKLSEELVANWIANSKIDYYKTFTDGVSYVNTVPTGDDKEVSISAMKVQDIAAGTYVIEYTDTHTPWTGTYKKIYKIVTIQQVQP